MGIALPQWIIEGHNNIWVLAVYGLVFGIGLPMLLVRVPVLVVYHRYFLLTLFIIGSMVVRKPTTHKRWCSGVYCRRVLQVSQRRIGHPGCRRRLEQGGGVGREGNVCEGGYTTTAIGCSRRADSGCAWHCVDGGSKARGCFGRGALGPEEGACAAICSSAPAAC